MTPHPDSPPIAPAVPPVAVQKIGRAWLTGFALLFYVFGAATGCGLAYVWWHRPAATPPPSGEAIAARINARLVDDYRLDAEESHAVQTAVSRSLAAIEERRQAFNREMREELQKLRGQVEPILGPDRSEDWDRKMEHHFGRHRVHNAATPTRTGHGGHH